MSALPTIGETLTYDPDAPSGIALPVRPLLPIGTPTPAIYDPENYPEGAAAADKYLAENPAPAIVESENVQYEFADKDGTKLNYDTSGPSTNVQSKEEIAQGIMMEKLFKLRMARMLLQKQKRDAIRAGAARNRVAKSRKKRKLEKASRKRNR